MFAKQLPLAERLGAAANQANKAGDYASAAKMYNAAYEIGGNVSKRISAANMLLKSGRADAAQEIYETVLVADAAAPLKDKLSDRRANLSCASWRKPRSPSWPTSSSQAGSRHRAPS
jgi:tetratricopeptide (TPR) repeat protein